MILLKKCTVQLLRLLIKKKKNDHMHDLESPFLLHWFKYMYFAVGF